MKHNSYFQDNPKASWISIKRVFYPSAAKRMLVSLLPKAVIRYVIQLAIPLIILSCSQDTHPLTTTYYHWQTELDPDTTARQLLRGSDRLYVKAFDVIWEDGQAAPTAEIQLVDTVGLPQLIPVIFITNEVIRRTSSDQFSALATDLSALTERLLPAGYPEIQLDGDWTARTQVPYFDLLEAMKRVNPGRKITCTIRLHQYRDRKEQGIPPVDRATLMAYNTGDVADWETENSIIDTNALNNYLAGQPAYPVPLDVAVAVYDWAAIYRRGKLVQLVNEPDLGVVGDTLLYTQLPGTRVRAKKAHYLNGVYIYQDDLIRHEIAGPERVKEEAARLQKYVGGFPGQRLMIYRLGSRLHVPN
ncbi:hypothetical protein [Neolewinella antarctica]|uniref:Uncharacterized protein n=1 Tax=Neolewinella antarctica TaxID=442734 RepID=A0ABX0XFD6_9BACT|nr:hypothetical protein [Neolewinella antarctica]NJC27946.1 hypothetical protein [Neolewinella antarctica]